MTSEDFAVMGRALLGKGWQTRLAERLEVDGSTIRRWLGTGMAIPSTASAFLSMMGDRQETRGALVYERQAIGSPVDVQADEGVIEHQKLSKTRRFPGVDATRRMPSVHISPAGDGLRMSLDVQAADEIDAPGTSFILTRHPDPYHLEGYRAAALTAGHRTTAIQHGDHFYSLLAHRGDGIPTLLHHIATHEAVNRLIWSVTSHPDRVIHQELI